MVFCPQCAQEQLFIQLYSLYVDLCIIRLLFHLQSFRFTSKEFYSLKVQTLKTLTVIAVSCAPGFSWNPDIAGVCFSSNNGKLRLSEKICLCASALQPHYHWLNMPIRWKGQGSIIVSLQELEAEGWCTCHSASFCRNSVGIRVFSSLFNNFWVCCFTCNLLWCLLLVSSNFFQSSFTFIFDV